MKISNIRKLAITSIFGITALAATQAQAALVQFTLDGIITTASQTNDYGLAIGNSITATGVYDNTPIQRFDPTDGSLIPGSTYIDFSLSSNTMSITVGNTVFAYADADTTKMHLFFQDGTFDGLNYDSTVVDAFDSWGSIGQTDSAGNPLEDFTGFGAGNNNWIGGNWDVYSFQVTAVPVPAAVWLFGSGIVFLAGIARRKQKLAV